MRDALHQSEPGQADHQRRRGCGRELVNEVDMVWEQWGGGCLQLGSFEEDYTWVLNNCKGALAITL